MRVTQEEMIRRKTHVLSTGLLVLGDLGIDRVSQNDLAAEAGVAHGCIQNYFGTYEDFKAQLVKYACEADHVKILAQAVGHPKFSHLLSKKDIQSVINHIKV